MRDVKSFIIQIHSTGSLIAIEKLAAVVEELEVRSSVCVHFILAPQYVKLVT